MPSINHRLQQIRYFLSRGPAYHATWARWRASRVSQRLLRQSYDAEYRHEVRRGRFFFDADQVPAIVANFSPEQRKATITAADALSRFSFRFRSSETVEFDGAVDWSFAPDGNADWRWDLNRHGWFETLGRAWHYTRQPDYGRVFETLLLDWLDKNPPAVDATNWSSAFEVGYRINSWSWSYHLFEDCDAIDPQTRAALLRGIGMHCEFLFRNLELNARNNHLLLESKALLLGAILFPGFRKSDAWRKRAEKLLLREVRGQVLPDGVHGEMSTHYHRVIAGELLELAVLYRLNDLHLPADVAQSIQAMADFENCVTRPDGSLPLIGDSASDDTYARLSARRAGSYVFGLEKPAYATVALDEDCHWRLAGIPLVQPRNIATRSRAFQDGGYYIMRSGDSIDDAMHAIINCGPFGLPSDPHHGHADALSIELFAAGRPWIVDSGVYSTHADWHWRRYFRGTRSHNTVVVNGSDQALLIDSRRAMRLPSSTCTKWDVGEDEDLFDGWHDGFARLGGGLVHRRIVQFQRGRAWVIADIITGQGTHIVESLYHCPDDVDIQLRNDRQARLLADRHATMQVAWTASAPAEARIGCGETDPIQGWYSKHSGQKRPAPTLILKCHTALPVIVAAAFVPGGNSKPELTLEDSTLHLSLGDSRTSLSLPTP